MAQSDAPAGEFIDVDTGEDHSCGLRTYGTAVCWKEGLQMAADERSHPEHAKAFPL